MAKTEAEPKSKSQSNGSTEIPDWQVIAGLKKSKIQDVVARAAELEDTITKAKAELSEIRQEGVKILVKAGVKTVLVDGLRVTRLDGKSSNLSKTRLLELGVSQKTIDKATTRTPWSSLKITRPGEKDQEEG